MIILKTLLSEGNSSFHHHHHHKSGFQKSASFIGSITDSTAEESCHSTDQLNKEAARKMEFMYCIPDLELFIDKTIKKCLLEYDLDANDTEAVLDDMEKAWPKSPPRSAEKQVLKDYNDNTENGSTSKQLQPISENREATPSEKSLDKPGVKDSDFKTSFDKSRGEEGMAFSDWTLGKGVGLGNGLTNGRKEDVRKVEEGTRSGSSSPDFEDGRTQPRKLKSRLQQRYFEGKQSSDVSADQKQNKERRDIHWDQQRHSNLDLLASAANIHTESARRGEEYTLQAVRRLQEDSSRQFHEQVTGKYQSNGGSSGTAGPSVSQPQREMPQLLRLMTAPTPGSTSSISHSHAPETIGQRVVPDDQGRAGGPGFLSAVPVSASSRDVRHLTTNERAGEPESLTDGDRARLLLQHYQDGYHALIPRESVVVRREVPGESGERKHTSISCLPTWTNATEGPTSSTPYRHYVPVSHSHLPTRQPSPPHGDTCHNSTHHHSSRIATIIAEELQKDNDCSHKSLVAHPTNAIFKPSTYVQDHLIRPNGHRHVVCKPVQPTSDGIVPGDVKISTLSDPTHIKQVVPSHHTQVGHVNCPVVSSSATDRSSGLSSGPGEPSATSYRHLPQLLPAHLVVTSTHAGAAVLPCPIRHNPFPTNGRDVYLTANAIIEDQPQDLSTRPRKTLPDEGAIQARPEFFTTNPDSPVTESGKAGYFSSPNSPLTIPTPVRHVESPALRKSASPSNNSDKECDYSSGNDTGNRPNPLKTSGKWERRGQVHGLDVLPMGTKDSKQLAEKRRAGALRRWSESRDEEVNKRRDLK